MGKYVDMVNDLTEELERGFEKLQRRITNKYNYFWDKDSDDIQNAPQQVLTYDNSDYDTFYLVGVDADGYIIGINEFNDVEHYFSVDEVTPENLAIIIDKGNEVL